MQSNRVNQFAILNRFVIIGLCVLIAALLQWQHNFFATADYKGLTINIADLLIPFAGLYVLATLLAHRTAWPAWRIRGGYIWLAVLTAVMTAALLNGYWQNGEWIRWALVNKYAGWFVLVAYFGLGGWLVTNGGAAAAQMAVRAFLLACLIIVAAQLAFYGWRDLTGDLGNSVSDFPPGLAGNRNAFAFLIVILLAGAGLSFVHRRVYIPAWLAGTALVMIPAILLYNGSRAGMLAAALVLAVMLWRHSRTTLRRVVPFLLLGGVLLLAFVQIPGVQVAQRFFDTRIVPIEQVTNPEMRPDRMTSQTQRLRVFEDSMAFWRSAPLTGIGLGTYWDYALENYGPAEANIIDSTPLWLLTETGIAGMALFAALFIAALWVLARGNKAYDPPRAGLNDLALYIMVGFMVMALFHELLYQRALWFFMGMALALPRLVTDSQKEA